MSFHRLVLGAGTCVIMLALIAAVVGSIIHDRLAAGLGFALGLVYVWRLYQPFVYELWAYGRLRYRYGSVLSRRMLSLYHDCEQMLTSPAGARLQRVTDRVDDVLVEVWRGYSRFGLADAFCLRVGNRVISEEDELPVYVVREYLITELLAPVARTDVMVMKADSAIGDIYAVDGDSALIRDPRIMVHTSRFTGTVWGGEISCIRQALQYARRADVEAPSS